MPESAISCSWSLPFQTHFKLRMKPILIKSIASASFNSDCDRKHAKRKPPILLGSPEYHC